MSLRLRLALLYGALTGLVVLVVGIATYAVHSREQYDNLDRVLASSVQHVAVEYARTTTVPQAAAILAVPLEPGVVIRLYGADGQVLAASPHSSSAPQVDPRFEVVQPAQPAYDPLVGAAPQLIPVDAGNGNFGLEVGPGGKRWRLYVLPVTGLAKYLVAAASLELVDASVNGFRQLVPVFTLAGAVVALLGGGLMAGRALHPVAMLTATAGAIARSRGFSRRVPVSNPRDELGRLAVTFNEMLASLEEAYRSQQRFVADASHELRAPLTAIQANLELLEQRPDMPLSDRAEAIAEAGRETRRLTRLVADLLALARADAGVPLRRQPVELDRLLMEATTEARKLARGQTVEVAAVEPVRAEGDPDRLKQLLLILLDNAIKYTPVGGTVTVAVRRAPRGAEVTVRDTGIGISPDDLPRVFERFYRADPARGRDQGGSGLGLPIARWIAQQHGGDVHLASEPGKGTMVTVRLPAAK